MAQMATKQTETATPARRWWRIGGVVACYLAATVVASVLTSPAHPRVLAPEPLLLAVLAGLVGALTVGPLAQRLHLPTGQRVAVVTLLTFVLTTVTNEVEALLFIKGSSALVPVTGAILALGLAVPVTMLWPPADTHERVGAALGHALISRPWWSWAWRIALTSVLWVPVYFVFAAADAPFVSIYYHQTGTTFTVPSGGIVAAAELFRGVLHALVLGALAALLGSGRLRSWLWLALAFAALNAWLPLVQRADWPYYLRAANIVEITCDAVVYGGLVALLLTRRVPQRRELAGTES
jgi:hypothetical protein